MFVETQDITFLYSQLLMQGLDIQEEFDNNHGSAIAITDQLIKTANCNFEWDLSTLGVSQRNWQGFLKRYFPDRSKIYEWCELAKKQAEGIDHVLQVQTKGRHHWGPCFLGISYRRKPEPRLFLFSRATYLPKPGIYELIVIHLLSGLLGSSPKFTWAISSLWWEPLGMMTYLALADPKLLKLMLLQNNPPTLVRYLQRDHKALIENRCTHLTRLKTWEKIQEGRQEPLWVKDLTF